MVAVEVEAAAAVGGHGGGGGLEEVAAGPRPSPASAPIPQQTPVNEVEIIGVVRSVDAQNSRITIAYEASDSLNLPAGTQPFDVARTDLLKAATVRFEGALPAGKPPDLGDPPVLGAGQTGSLGRSAASARQAR